MVCAQHSDGFFEAKSQSQRENKYVGGDMHSS